jgi:hypothetical protein
MDEKIWIYPLSSGDLEDNLFPMWMVPFNDEPGPEDDD